MKKQEEDVIFPKKKPLKKHFTKRLCPLSLNIHIHIFLCFDFIVENIIVHYHNKIINDFKHEIQNKNLLSHKKISLAKKNHTKISLKN